MEITIKGNVATIVVDLSKNPPLSKSGKSKLLASSGGFVATTAKFNDKVVSVGLNITIPVD